MTEDLVPEQRHSRLSESFQLVRYDSMCRAIAAAYKVDEVKDIRDKSIALEAYFKQAKNTEAERRACEIRLRAERKAGVLLKTMQRARGRPSKEFREGTLSDLGISRKQSAKWQQLADVPESEFEAALASPKKPSTSSLVNGSKPKKQMNPKALWLWGRLRDFEREGILDARPEDLLEEMTAAMRADVRRLAQLIADWLGEIE